MIEINYFTELFMNTQMWGYLGPMALVIVGYLLSRKDKTLGIFWFIVEMLFVGQYLGLVIGTPAYWWHIFILLFGGMLTCIFPLWDR